jgi:hypothetical protein
MAILKNADLRIFYNPGCPDSKAGVSRNYGFLSHQKFLKYHSLKFSFTQKNLREDYLSIYISA